jgi:hypothetical protein
MSSDIHACEPSLFLQLFVLLNLVKRVPDINVIKILLSSLEVSNMCNMYNASLMSDKLLIDWKPWQIMEFMLLLPGSLMANGDFYCWQVRDAILF